MNRDNIKNIFLTDEFIGIELSDGRTAYELFKNYPRLASATHDARENYTISHFGIHWPEIDEDLSFNGFFNK